MGLASDLGYGHQSANLAQRVLRWMGGTRVGGSVFSRTMRHIDNTIARLTNGRHSFPGLLTGLAVLALGSAGVAAARVSRRTGLQILRGL